MHHIGSTITSSRDQSTGDGFSILVNAFENQVAGPIFRNPRPTVVTVFEFGNHLFINGILGAVLGNPAGNVVCISTFSQRP